MSCIDVQVLRLSRKTSLSLLGHNRSLLSITTDLPNRVEAAKKHLGLQGKCNSHLWIYIMSCHVLCPDLVAVQVNDESVCVAHTHTLFGPVNAALSQGPSNFHIPSL